jgi:hypothetical protein
MLSGTQFRLKIETLGIEALEGNQRIAVKVPVGSVVKVLAGPTDYDRSMVEVLWAGHRLAMFLEDVQGRGEPVTTTGD